MRPGTILCVAGALCIHGRETFAQPPNASLNAATAEDHRDMMRQLGIQALRPGPSGNESAPNHANYDETVANPFPDYPEILRLKNGARVATAQAWWQQRRPEIMEDFEREVLGRVPAGVPRVAWTIVREVRDKVGPWPVIARELKGTADNSAYPQIEVNIQLVLVTPAWVKARVPVMMMFGRPPCLPIPYRRCSRNSPRSPDPILRRLCS